MSSLFLLWCLFYRNRSLHCCDEAVSQTAHSTHSRLVKCLYLYMTWPGCADSLLQQKPWKGFRWSINIPQNYIVGTVPPKMKFSHYLLTPLQMESRHKPGSPHNLNDALQQNGISRSSGIIQVSRSQRSQVDSKRHTQHWQMTSASVGSVWAILLVLLSCFFMF